MSENVSPNVVRRKQRQTKLVFNKNNEIILDSKPLKNISNPPMNSKRRKKEEQFSDEHKEPEVHNKSPSPSPEVDPRLEDVPNNDSNSQQMVVNEAENEVLLEIDWDLLMSDCLDNNPSVKTLKSVNQLREECTSLVLILDDQFCDEVNSDDESEQTASDPKSDDFEVESIYDSRIDSDRLTTYLVKWKNWTDEYNTWEPLSNLLNCRKLLDEFRQFKKLSSDRMDVYRNYYRLRGIIEDIVERKLQYNVMTTLLLSFNDIPLKDFSYTKAMVNKMRNDLRDRHLSEIDKISGITNTEKRVERIVVQYNKLINDLNISKRFHSFEKFSEFFTKRKQSEFRLNRWENQINDTIIEAKEGQTIRLENFVDCEIPPSKFEYISKCRTSKEDIIISDDPPLFCQCEDCETQSEECCVASNQSTINYTKNGILKNSRNAIYECNNRCECSDNCINRVVQKGRKHKLAVFRTDDDKGWGVRALEYIQKGSYVMEYVGEIISVDEADRRGHIYDAEGRTYLFDLDFTPDGSGKYTLDATQCGNVSHFVNHSCDPNLDTRVVWINNLDPFMPHIALFAVRNIKVNEELTFDYKINVHGITDVDQNRKEKDSTINTEKSDDSGIYASTSETTSEVKPVRVSCRCGAANCRQFLY